MIFDQFGTFSIFGLFFMKGTDDQEREVRSFWNHFLSIYHVKIGLLDDFRQICNIFDFRTLFHEGTDDQEWMKLVMDLVLIYLRGHDKNFDV